MPRNGRHRSNKPKALIAAATTVLIVLGAALAVGSSAADSGGVLATLAERQGNDSDSDRSSDGDSEDDRGSSDEDEDDGASSDDSGSEGEPSNGNDDESERGDEKDGESRIESADDTGDENPKEDNGKDDNGKDENAEDENAEDDPFPGRDQAARPDADDYVEIADVEPDSVPTDKGGVVAGGSYTSDCGTGDHRNSDNYQAAPGKRNGAQHNHDYVGNKTTNAFSDTASLEAGGTSCTNGDKSTYYWPVIRDLDGVGDDVNEDGGGKDGNKGRILTADSVELTYSGHPGQETQPMPRGLKLATGDAKAKTNGDAKVNAKWTCSGFTDRVTTKYPICPSGSKLMRFLDFQSCWNGADLESKDGSHVAFPNSEGRCGEGTVPVPQLRMTLTYDQPPGRAFAVDTFPEQQHDPRTDHGNFENVMPEAEAREAARCINDGRRC